jgi:hypothetical protein
MSRSALSAAAALLALAGCSETPAPVEVSRFSRPELSAAPRGAIAIVPAPGNDAGSIEFQNYAAAVTRELAGIGYPQGTSGSLVATLDVQRQFHSAAGGGNTVSLGAAGSGGGGYSSGAVGIGVGINLNGGPKEQVETWIGVSIRDQATGVALWEARARYVVGAKTPEGQDAAVAAKMAHALFQGFPGKSGETILVP